MTNILIYVIYPLAILGGFVGIGWILSWFGKKVIAAFKEVCAELKDLGFKAELKFSLEGKQTPLRNVKEIPLKPKLENAELKIPKTRNQKQIKS